MAGLFGAIWLALFGATKISDAIEDSREMAEPRYYSPETGQPIYIDRKGVYHGKGREKMETNFYHDSYGNMHTQLIGRRTGTVYEDSGLRYEAKSQQLKMESIRKGYLAYGRWHPKFKRSISCDVKNDKFIAAIEKSLDLDKSIPSNMVYICKKYYLKEDANFYFSYNKDDFDYITSEEFRKLDYGCTKTFRVIDSSNDYEFKNGYWYGKHGRIVKLKEDVEYYSTTGEVCVAKKGSHCYVDMIAKSKIIKGKLE